MCIKSFPSFPSPVCLKWNPLSRCAHCSEPSSSGYPCQSSAISLMFCLLLVMATAVLPPQSPLSLCSKPRHVASCLVRLNGTPWPLCWVVSQIRMPHARPGSDHHSMWSACLPACVCACVCAWLVWVCCWAQTGHRPWMALAAVARDPLPTGQLALISFNCVCQTQMHFNANNARGDNEGKREREMDGNRNCARFSFNNKRGTFWPKFSYENCLRTKLLKWHSGK